MSDAMWILFGSLLAIGGVLAAGWLDWPPRAPRLAFDPAAAAPMRGVRLFTDDQVARIDAAADALPPTSQES